jgi:hypothetical protein
MNIHSLAWMIFRISDNNSFTGPIPSELGLLPDIRFSIMDYVIGSSFEDDFPNSLLQEEALDWLVNLDSASLPVDTNPTILLERFTAVLFYNATQGDGWFGQAGWLSESPPCAWSGLECNDEGFLTGMDLGTCLLSSICLSNESVRSLCLGNLLYYSG